MKRFNRDMHEHRRFDSMALSFKERSMRMLNMSVYAARIRALLSILFLKWHIHMIWYVLGRA
jgi:hypothetical protein